MCNYMGHHFGANYPDGECVQGWIFDSDNCEHGPTGLIMYAPVDQIPCPRCNADGSTEFPVVGEDGMWETP